MPIIIMATTQFLTGVSFLRNGFFSWRTDWPGSTSGSFLRTGFFLFHISDAIPSTHCFVFPPALDLLQSEKSWEYELDIGCILLLRSCGQENLQFVSKAVTFFQSWRILHRVLKSVPSNLAHLAPSSLSRPQSGRIRFNLGIIHKLSAGARGKHAPAERAARKFPFC